MGFVCLHCNRNAFKLTTDSAGRTIFTCLRCGVPLPIHAPTMNMPRYRSGRDRGRRESRQLAVA